MEPPRDYFEIQLLLAERMAERRRLALGAAALQFTNLYRRFGLGRAAPGEVQPAVWRRYAERLEALGSSAERLDWTLECFRDAAGEEAPAPNRFGCFRFDPPDGDGVVRIHFNNRDGDDGIGPLAASKTPRRLAELKAMIARLRADHPKAATIRGGSWLYNLDAYRRLFPDEYAASIWTPEAVRLDGTSTWGQVLDRNGAVKPAVRETVLRNLDTLDDQAPWLAFPLRALAAQAPVEAFHRFYQQLPD
jgi:hypothetical protein